MSTTNAYDEYDPARLRSEKLIAEHTKPELKRKPELRSKLDTHYHPERKQLEDFVSRQIAATLGKALTDSHEFIQDAIARVVAHLQDGFEDKLDIIKSKHANDIAELKSQIKELELKSKRGPRGPRGARGPACKPPEVHNWHIDKDKFRVTCFFADGTSLPYLDLYPLFQSFLNQTSGRP
jgi:hypothetical protein